MFGFMEAFDFFLQTVWNGMWESMGIDRVYGFLGCTTPQKGIVSYSLSANRQRPLAGAFNAAIFNTWRRFRHQVLYVAPPFIIAYSLMNWANER
jgi:hypothetical protein